jgi:K+-transporting ATPase A subunit
MPHFLPAAGPRCRSRHPSTIACPCIPGRFVTIIQHDLLSVQAGKFTMHTNTPITESTLPAESTLFLFVIIVVVASFMLIVLVRRLVDHPVHCLDPSPSQ